MWWALVQRGHQTQRHEDRPFPDRSFTLERLRCCSLLSTRSCWLHSCILSATFLTASSSAFLASLSGLVLGVQILGALPALFLIDTLFPARLSVLGALRCFMQRHIPHSLVCRDPPSVSWFEQPTEGYDSRDRSLWLFVAEAFNTTSVVVRGKTSCAPSLFLLRCCAGVPTHATEFCRTVFC